MINVTVNGTQKQIKIEPRTTLLEALREELGLRGTKYGCGEGECGACTVVVDGETACSCLVLAGSVDGREITTVEGLEDDALGAAIIDNFARAGAVQCGFCTPGFIVQGWSAVGSGEVEDRQGVCDALGGNLCRCTGYTKIVDAMEKSLHDAKRAPAPQAGQGQADGGTANSLRSDGYWRPTSLAELRSGLPDVSEPYYFLAGGTDLLVKEVNRLKGHQFVDLTGLSELRYITVSEGTLRIGATATWTDIARSPLVTAHAPVLGIAAVQIGAGQIQNRGTLVGNIANASPAADGLPPLYAYDAFVALVSATGERQVPISEFVVGPGRTALRPGEVISEVLIPRAESRREEVYFFEKRGPRLAQTISKASIAYHAWVGSAGQKVVRIAVGAVAATVLRVPEAERLLADGGAPSRAAEMISEIAKPITDVRSTAEYRRALVGRLLLRGLADRGCLGNH